MTKVLFVCLGNICRSPAADGVMAHLIKTKGLTTQLACDSAGTSAYHEGEPADGRMKGVAKERGFDLTSISRQFLEKDFEEFDYILTMDKSNYSDILAMDFKRQYLDKVIPFTKFCTQHTLEQVPDPYYGMGDGFNLVMDIVEDGCNGFLEKLKNDGIIQF